MMSLLIIDLIDIVIMNLLFSLVLNGCCSFVVNHATHNNAIKSIKFISIPFIRVEPHTFPTVDTLTNTFFLSLSISISLFLYLSPSLYLSLYLLSSSSCFSATPSKGGNESDTSLRPKIQTFMNRRVTFQEIYHN